MRQGYLPGPGAEIELSVRDSVASRLSSRMEQFRRSAHAYDSRGWPFCAGCGQSCTGKYLKAHGCSRCNTLTYA